MGWETLPENLKTFTHGKNTFDYVAYSGTVVGKSQWSDTYVSGQGDRHGSVVTSDVVQRLEFFLKDRDSGQEEAFKFSDAKFAVRDGQFVSIVWATLNGQKTGPFRRLVNHTANDHRVFPFNFKGLRGMGGALSGFFLVLLGIACGIAAYVQRDDLRALSSALVAPAVLDYSENYAHLYPNFVTVRPDSPLVPFLSDAGRPSYKGEFLAYPRDVLLPMAVPLTAGIGLSVVVFFAGGRRMAGAKDKSDALFKGLEAHEAEIVEFLRLPDEMQETRRLMGKLKKDREDKAASDTATA